MNKEFRIAHIVLSLDIGGLEKLAIDLAKHNNTDKSYAMICCLDDPGPLANEAEAKGVKIIAIRKGPGINFGLPLKLASILAKEKINVAHTHNAAPLLYGTLAAKIARTPVLIHTKHGRERKIENRFIWNSNNAIVTISEDAKRELLKYNRIEPDKIKVIHNGIDIEQYANEKSTSQMRETLDIEPSASVLGTVARLSPEKDQTTLLTAFSKVVQVVNNARLLVVGNGSLRQKLEGQCEEMGIRESVIFTGFRNDIPEVMAAFDVFVLSSVTEGISLTLLEAMAANKAVIATNVGGNPEVVDDGITGILVPPENPENMATEIIGLLRNRALAKRMGKAGYNRVKNIFSLDQMAKQYEALYENLLNKVRQECKAYGKQKESTFNYQHIS